ncbi:MAG: sigma factor [Acidimicrobiales bacterium]
MVAQRTFERVWLHATSYDSRRGSVRTWVLTICRRQTIDAWRLERSIPLDPDDLGDLLAPSTARTPEDHAEAAHEIDRARAEVLRLPLPQRRAVLLATLGAGRPPRSPRSKACRSAPQRRGCARASAACASAWDRRIGPMDDVVPTGCEPFGAELGELATGAVDPAEVPDVAVHLETCARCRLVLDELAATADRVALLGPEREPPPGFEARALTSFRGAQPRHRAAALASPRAERRRWPALAAAAVVAALVFGLVVGRRSAPTAPATSGSSPWPATVCCVRPTAAPWARWWPSGATAPPT